MWDNRCCLHRGLPFDDLRYRRDMQRATVLDVANSCEQEGITPPEVVLRAAEYAHETCKDSRKRGALSGISVRVIHLRGSRIGTSAPSGK